ncbi:hypothetical protein RND71_008252 [Anisodus tanguticus]|uniref:Uncharacterized protein n=1 Tax=Anisodus tanguticus TaxID=243964 RepID=A0AAE1SKG7_9SOLA|nr:hypothetical protein RND71_008252 [Anisodus tanguticus]
MAKGGKLRKLKSVFKKMRSFKIGRSSNVMSPNSSCSDDDSYSYRSHCSIKDQHTVYVGKSRRHYLVSSDFMELAQRSGDSIAVGCEVVLFEHLLWMFENADPQPESLDELVEFYSC